MTARNARKFAEQANPTPTGVVLEVKVYAYPDGHFEFTATGRTRACPDAGAGRERFRDHRGGAAPARRARTRATGLVRRSARQRHRA